MAESQIGAWLQRQLVRRDWRAADLARELGVPSGTVSRWLKGRQRVAPDYCERIADVLGFDVDDVLTLAGHRPPDDDFAADDPKAELVGLIRRIRLTDEREFLIRGLLRQMLDFDRQQRARPER